MFTRLWAGTPTCPTRSRKGHLRTFAAATIAQRDELRMNETLAPLLLREPGVPARAREMAVVPAETKKKVLVVGAGAAGLEAARAVASAAMKSRQREESVLLLELNLATMVLAR